MFRDVSIIIVTHNHKDYLDKCLNSIPKDLKIILVDNNSTDGTIEFIEKKYPQITLIKSKKNLGYGKGVNIGVEKSKDRYILVLNPDTWFNQGFIEEIIKPLENQKNIITTPKTLLYDGSNINTCGNINHFTGLGFTRGLGEKTSKFDEYEFINGLSGVCFAIERENFLKIGGFDENIFLYMEDTELSWKIKSKNMKILYVPKAIIYHDYVFKVPSEKIYNLEKGRYLILRKYLSLKIILMFLPSFIMTEVITWGYSFLKGYTGIKSKFNAVIDSSRMNIEKEKCDQKKLLRSLDTAIPSNITPNVSYNVIEKICNYIYYINYFLIMKIWK